MYACGGETQQLETQKFVCLAFELMEGGDLQKYLLSRGSTPEEIALPEPEAKKVFRQILSAIHYAHQNGVIHRDLKLENVL
jgi:serine/threonine protein kinase